MIRIGINCIKCGAGPISKRKFAHLKHYSWICEQCLREMLDNAKVLG